MTDLRITLESLTIGLPSETVSKPRLERKYAFLTAPSEKPAYSSCKSELIRRSSSTCEADGVLVAGVVAVVVVGAGVGTGVGAAGAAGLGSGAGWIETGSGVIGLASGVTGLGSATTGVGVTGLGSGVTGLGSGAGVATMGLGSGAAGLGSGVATTGLGVMVGLVGLGSGAATTGLGSGVVGTGFKTVVVVGAGFGVACVTFGFAGLGLVVATTAGFGVGLGVATEFGTGAGLGAIGVVILCWDCVRKIGEPTFNAPEGLNVVVGRIAAPANGTAGFAPRTATGTGRGRLGAPGNTGGKGWARGTTIVCVIRGGCATTDGVLRTGEGALIVGVGVGAELTVMLLGGRCKLEPAVAVRGRGANGLSARGAAAGRGLVCVGCALLVAVLIAAGFVVF